MSPLERARYVRNLILPAYPKLVLWPAISHADRSGKFWISQARFALEASQSVRRLRSSIAWLRSHGLLIEIPRPGRSSAFKVTLEAYRDLHDTPAPRADPPRHDVPTEVAPVKVRTRKSRKPRKSRQQREAEKAADVSSIIHLFPEAQRNRS